MPAVAIALWRAHGDTCFPGWGVFEFYRQNFGTGAVDREPSPWPAPQTEPADVVLKAPTSISSMTGRSGRPYVPDAAGHFRVTAEDSKPLIVHGWIRVEPS